MFFPWFYTHFFLKSVKRASIFDCACCRQLIIIVMMSFLSRRMVMLTYSFLHLLQSCFIQAHLPPKQIKASNTRSRAHSSRTLQVLYNHIKVKIRTSLFIFHPKLHFNLIHNSYTLSLSRSFLCLRENFNIPGYTVLNPAKTHYTATHNCSRSPQKWDAQNVTLSFSPHKWLPKTLWSANYIYSKIRL